jgi:hypothetical protein
MQSHKYILEPYKGMSSRYRCIECNKGKTFSRYIDTETGEHIADHVGRCNRVDNCGNHYTPKQYFQENNISFDRTPPNLTKPYIQKIKVAPPPKPVSFIPVEIFKQSLKSHNQNNFVKFLLTLFGSEITGKLVSKYFIGTSKHWQGANVFWQIDNAGKIRTGKIMLYNSTTGKRVKEPYNHITWVHTALKLPEYELRQCFEAEHLLSDITKPIAITESIKTAIIASVYLPQFIWIAAGSKDGLNLGKCSVLAGRNVNLFPDLNGFEKWCDKAKELSHIARFTVSDLLERKASEAEKKDGLDLADYLIRFDYKQFALPETIVYANESVTALHNDLLNIHSNDILIAPITTYLSKEFNHTAILYVKTTKGKFDLLFDEDGELIQPGNDKLVTDIESYFDKKLIPATFDNMPCYVHHHN